LVVVSVSASHLESSSPGIGIARFDGAEVDVHRFVGNQPVRPGASDGDIRRALDKASGSNLGSKQFPERTALSVSRW